MRAVATVILNALLISITLAQTARNNDEEKLKARNAPDVFIYSAAAFGPDRNGDSNFTIEIGNTGKRIVTSVVWEYDPSREDRKSASGSEPQVSFRNDFSRADRESALNSKTRFSFRNDFSGLQPNQRSKLTNKVHRYTDKFVASFHLGTVRIVQVDYEDGSSWRRIVDN